MNDNLRYKSLQYIKGDNYDNITCFDNEEINKINYEQDAKTLINNLKNVKQEALCNIGEKLIDDLVYYYEFKKYNKKLKEVKKVREEEIEKFTRVISSKKTEFKNKGLNKKMKGKTIKQIVDATLKCLEEMKINKARLNEYCSLDDSNIDEKELKVKFQKLKKIITEAIDITSYEYDNDYETEIVKLTELNTYLDTLDNDSIYIDLANKINNGINNELETYVNALNGYSDNIKRKFKELQNNIKRETEESKQIEHIKKFQTYANEELEFSIPSNDVLKNLKLTKKHIEKYVFINSTLAEDKKSIQDENTKIQVITDIEDTKIIEALKGAKEKTDSLEETYSNEIKKNEGKKSVLTNLVKLFNEHSKICEENIKKYEKIFKYNDISGIDDAFMIKSYSDFLKKLNKLKENLESKDTAKIKRSLIDSIQKLINLYGLNITNKATLEGDNLKFLAKRIIDYV
jgi:hypothetical protein